MDSSEFATIFDAITGGNCAERFLSTLAADSPPNLAPPASDLLISTPAFDMPLVAAQASQPIDFLQHAPSPIPPPLVSHHLLDTPYLLPDYSIPASAVTASYRSNSNSVVHHTPIHKKKRSSSHRTKKEPIPLLPVTPTPPNVSFASDVSAVTPADHLSPSYSNSQLPAKSESCPSTHPTSRTNPSDTIPVPIARSPTKSKSSVTTPPPPPPPPKSHTRKCREKVTRQFENLLEVLPTPPRGVEVKHKAQILDYTINIFKDLLLRRTSLQAEIALASKPALMQWINTAIASTAACMKRDARAGPVPMSAVLEPFVGLYCVKNNWTYGEMWLVDPDKQQASLSSFVFNSDDSDILKRLDAFAAESRKRYQVPSRLESGMISRAMARQRPEWLEQPASDPSVFSRADIASSHGICLVETIPIVIGNNRCSGVLLFADVKPHKFSTTDMTVGNEYAEVISESYLQYLQRVQQRCVTVPVDARIQPKPICSAETKPNVSNQLLSTEARLGGMGCAAPGMTNGIQSQTDTNSRFFSDSHMMTRRCY